MRAQSGVVFLPLSPAVRREGYNEQYCANARERIDFHEDAAQTHVECIGLCGIADERVDLCGHRANHAERIGLCWTLCKRTLSALGRNFATQEKSLACPCGDQRRKIPAQRPPAFACADAALAKAASCKGSIAQTRIECATPQRRPHATDAALAPNNAAPSPQREPHCQQTTSPRMKGLPWWNLLAN